MLHKIYRRATEVYLKNGNLIESDKGPHYGCSEKTILAFTLPGSLENAFPKSRKVFCHK